MSAGQHALVEPPGLSFKKVSKSYGSGDLTKHVLWNFDLDVAPGERVALFGPNGAGKSTVLRLAADLCSSDKGVVETISGGQLEPTHGFVFQAYSESLMPWLSCLDNVSLPLALGQGKGWDAARLTAARLIETLEFDLPLSNRPNQMSGGQKQLTAIARALLVQPSMLLLDEPFSSLDYPNRIRVMQILAADWERNPKTTLLVSHELDEAIYLSDRIVILEPASEGSPVSFPIGIPRPRSLNVLDSVEFSELRRRVLGHFLPKADL